MTEALAERLRPVQDALADLEREHLHAARASDEPDAWGVWSDLSRALLAVRAAQGCSARAAGSSPGTAGARP
jgi:hypothetical protein